MTPRQATAVLNEYFARNPETSKVLTGMNNIGTQPVSDHWDTLDGKYQKAMEAAGLVTIAPPKGKIYNPANHNQWMYALDVKLTERGKRMVRGKPQIIPAPSKNTWDTVYENVVFCTKHVLKIASISTTGDIARADYTDEYASFTPFYDAFHLANPTDTNTCSTQPQDATASRCRVLAVGRTRRSRLSMANCQIRLNTVAWEVLLPLPGCATSSS